MWPQVSSCTGSLPPATVLLGLAYVSSWPEGQAPALRLQGWNYSPDLEASQNYWLGLGRGSRENGEIHPFLLCLTCPQVPPKYPSEAGTLLQRTIYLWTVLCWGHQEFTALNPILFVHLFSSMTWMGANPIPPLITQSLSKISYKQMPRQKHTERSGTRTVFRHRAISI